MKISAINSKASNFSAFSISSLHQAQPTGLSVHPKASMRKFLSESVSHMKPQIDSHYDTVVKDLQKLVNIEECKRALKDLNKQLANFDQDLADPKLSRLEREIKIFQKPFRYQTRSAINFLLGNLEEAFADEWAHQSLDFDFYKQIDFPFLKHPNYSYQNALNDTHKYTMVVAGIGSLLFNQEEAGIDQLNLAASAGSSQALLLLQALGKTPPAPMNCAPVQPQSKENEDIFAHLNELFQQQKYSQVIEETDQFLTDAKLESWEGRFFFHIRGASKAALKDYTGAIADYDQAGYHHEWLIEKALVKILAGDREGAKADLQAMPATRGYPHVQPISAHTFATYDFEPWKTRAMMIEKLFEL